MDEATLKRAIEPFFSTKGVGRGTGLGLSMVHGLAAQLGGALTIKSRPGVGTVVELHLPITAEQAEAKTEDSGPDASAGAGTVLLVDDEEIVRSTTADMLGDLGYIVVEADCAEAALRMLDSGTRIDLLVTDHLMPGMTGTELIDELRGRRQDIPALLISGYAEGDGVPTDFPRLTKPFRRAELAAALQDVATQRTRDARAPSPESELSH
jgi:CheY-like chemotaxis protein